MSSRHPSIDLPSVGATPVFAARATTRALLPIDLLLLARRCGTLA